MCFHYSSACLCIHFPVCCWGRGVAPHGIPRQRTAPHGTKSLFYFFINEGIKTIYIHKWFFFKFISFGNIGHWPKITNIQILYTYRKRHSHKFISLIHCVLYFIATNIYREMAFMILVLFDVHNWINLSMEVYVNHIGDTWFKLIWLKAGHTRRKWYSVSTSWLHNIQILSLKECYYIGLHCNQFLASLLLA